MAALRIDIFQRHAIEGTSRPVAETLQSFVSVLPFVVQVIGWTLRRLLPNRSRRSNSGRHAVRSIFQWLKTAGKCFPGDRLKQKQSRIIKTVQPDNRFAAVTVSVPGHRVRIKSPSSIGIFSPSTTV